MALRWLTMADKAKALSDVFGDTSAGGLTSSKSGLMYSSAERKYTADPSNIVQRFESIDARDDAFGFELPELDLPGFGTKYDDCGDEIPRFCADCGATHTVGRTCYRSQCPRCGAAWARRQGTEIAAKLEATRRYLESQGSDRWDGNKFHHLAMSPPEGFETFTKEALDRTFEIVKEVLDELGVSTGVMLYHPYSGDGEGDDLGEWKGRLFEGREWSDVLEELEHRPHFHVVCIAKHVDGGYVTKAIEEQTGWIVERITKGDTDVSIYDKFDLCRVVSYCLSHTGLRETESGRTQAAYRYFGRVANLPAADHIKAEIDAAMRSVAPRTLDLDWSSLACQKDRDGRDPQSWLVASPDQAAAGEPDGYPEDSDGDDFGPLPPEDTCAGRMLHLSRAPEFLKDSEWCENAPRSDELADTWDEWKDEIEEPPPTD